MVLQDNFFCKDVPNINSSKIELNKMLFSMKNRGPDGQGLYFDEKIILGMRRLSIIDLKDGMQPIFNENKSIVVVFNGEIYNYIELKEDLVVKGHNFKTNTDTEILVHLYEEYGENFSRFLNGMFSYALWDKEKEVFILSRDRVGEKPLYYTVNNNKFIFASEIKSILLCDGIDKKPDFLSINDLLSFNYIPYPKTAFEGIYRLEPSTTIVYKGDILNKILGNS